MFISMDAVSVNGREFLLFPRLDGWNDLFFYEGRVYQKCVERVSNKLRRGLYCAHKIVELSNYGLRLEGEKPKCDETPDRLCGHVISLETYVYHHLFRAVKIGLSYLK